MGALNQLKATINLFQANCKAESHLLRILWQDMCYFVVKRSSGLPGTKGIREAALKAYARTGHAKRNPTIS